MVVKNVEKTEKSKVKFTVELSGEEFEAALNKAYIKNKGNINVPGFRRGKAPRMVVEGMYGKEFFYEDAVNETAADAFAKGTADEAIKAVGRPSLVNVDIAEDKTAELTFETAVYPEVKAGQYKGLEAEKEKAEVTDKDVEAELERVRLRNARLVTVSRPAQSDDEVTIDFKGMVDGVPFAGGEGKDHKLVLGSGQFIPGFEDGIIGMEPGGEKDLDVTFPTDYHKELAGKAAVFHVTVKEVKENKLDDIDDEFAKDVSEFETLEEYKADIRENLTAVRERDSEQKYREALIDIAVENMEVDVPEAMTEEKVGQMMEELAGGLAAQGLTIEKYLEFTGAGEAEFFESAKPAALKHVKRELLLSQIAKEEKIEVTDEELEEEYRSISARYEIDPERAKESMAKEFLAEDIRIRKAADLIFASAAVKTRETKPKKTVRKKEAAQETKPETEKQNTEEATAGKPGEKKIAAEASGAETKKRTVKKTAGKSGAEQE
ncbi:MAG: trigger factor [Oscillospiraceae bacterium]|nr:trigger factor [Oscillospiraceae bacterium]